MGQTQHWVAEIIERRIPDPTQLPTEMAVLPADPREWPAWLSQSAHAIRGSEQTLQWLATDAPDDAGAWFVERRPDGVTWQPAIQQAG